MNDKLDNEEKELLEILGKEVWVKLPEEEVEQHKTIAKNTLRKDKRINIRISNKDLLEIKRKATVEGIPYQTLVSSIIHKYLNGSLTEKAS